MQIVESFLMYLSVPVILAMKGILLQPVQES